MATPILNTVPSYDVDNGVTLTFNSNYGTNLVKGSRVIIFDQNQNILAWHIYVPSTYNEASTQHVIPSKQALINESTTPNAYDSSATYQVDAIVTYDGDTYRCIRTVSGVAPTDNTYWVKAISGEATLSYVANDFNTKYANETQLQFLVTVFVDYEVSNYEVELIGESADSNIRGAWVLPTPTIAFDTIPSLIDTTSYVLGLTYSTQQTTSAGLVYNPPQSMSFTLYEDNDGVWEVISTSGKVYNSGSALSNSEYYANYPFYLLVNGKSYKISVEIESLLGMHVSSMTSSFTVNATTYQISSFDVVNDACNGKVDITSKIVDVVGTSDVEPSGGEINLSGDGDYCTWDRGLAFTNNWTSRWWGYGFHVADTIENSQAIFHLASSTTNGVIDGYIVEDPNGYRCDLYVYPTGYDGVVSYFQSNVVDNLGTQANPLCILVGFDYDNSGTYYVRILTS